ncbi:hypothetical protein BMG00_16605 [Thioclava marina]|uniref:Uncharacterized protein n=1 Tax=Thioclava marina TaxID=1915077 RepID=A0ABX3MJ97_9RHOB|nr:hypothetical protein BMG00_16605 [Thioclava marina]
METCPHASDNVFPAAPLTGSLMIVLDLSIIFTGQPEGARTLAFGPVALSEVRNAYRLSFGGRC